MADRQNFDVDERERIRRHELVKDDVRRQVHSEIAGQASVTPAERAREVAAADAMKRRAIDDVSGMEREIARGRVAARGSQIIDYAFYLIYGIVGLATALEAIGASRAAGFTRFVEAMAWPFLAPFRGIMHDPAVGVARFRLSYAVALAAYVLLHLAINGLFRLFAQRKTMV